MGASPNANAAGKEYLDLDVSDGAFLQGGLKSESPTDGMGYGTGAGGAVTQITSDSTAVEINKVCGQITTFALVLAALVDTTFTVNNSVVEAGDYVGVSIKSYGGTADGIPVVNVVATAAGSFDINLMNNGAVTLDALAVITFIVHKAVIA